MPSEPLTGPYYWRENDRLIKELVEALETLYEASLEHERAAYWDRHWQGMWEAARVAPRQRPQ